MVLLYLNEGYLSVANPTSRKIIENNSYLEQSHLTGFSHAGEATQRFELFNVGFGQLAAAVGKLFN